MRILSSEVVTTAYKVTKTVTGIECDICKRFIKAKKYPDDTEKYYIVTTGHRDWGNDSCDSINMKDVCQDCIVNFTSDYLSKTHSDTAYIEIETELAEVEKETIITDKPPKEGETEKEGYRCY